MARRLIEAGTRVRAGELAVRRERQSGNRLLGHARRELRSAEESALPEARPRLSALLEDMDQRGMLKETLVVAIGEFGRSPRMGVSTSGNTQLAGWPRSLAVLLQRRRRRLRHRARGMQYGESDPTASSPKEKPVHPNDLLATVYYALGIDPDMEIRNHLNQPRELVKGKIVADLWA